MGAKWFGAHVSAQGGVSQAISRALELQASALALFVKNQRVWSSPTLKPEEIRSFRKAAFESGAFQPRALLPHAGYLINLGNPETSAQKRSLQALCDEMERCQQLGLVQLNLHPGSSLGKISKSQACAQISEHLTEALSRVSDVELILENTAGQGYQLGSQWEDLAQLLGRIPTALRARMGVCLDTCHAFAAGYPLHTDKGWEQTFESFEAIVGKVYLKALHINDSKGGLGSRLDRHASLGAGALGLECFRRIAQDPRFNDMPLILETPEPERWPHELAWLRGEGQTPL